MQVDVYQVVLTLERSRRTLNKSIAKQFPIKHASDRQDLAIRAEPKPEAICKVQGSVLDRDLAGWFILAEDPIAGLAWFRPATFHGKWEQEIIDRGGWVDDLASIPTAVL